MAKASWWSRQCHTLRLHTQMMTDIFGHFWTGFRHLWSISKYFLIKKYVLPLRYFEAIKSSANLLQTLTIYITCWRTSWPESLVYIIWKSKASLDLKIFPHTLHKRPKLASLISSATTFFCSSVKTEGAIRFFCFFSFSVW